MGSDEKLSRSAEPRLVPARASGRVHLQLLPTFVDGAQHAAQQQLDVLHAHQVHLEICGVLCCPPAESFGVSAQICSGVVRGGPEVRFHEGSTRVKAPHAVGDIT